MPRYEVTLRNGPTLSFDDARPLREILNSPRTIDYTPGRVGGTAPPALYYLEFGGEAVALDAVAAIRVAT